MKKRRSRWENIPRAGAIDSMALELELFIRIRDTLDEFVGGSRPEFWSIPIVWNRNLKNTAGLYFQSAVRTHYNAGPDSKWAITVDVSREHIELHPGLTLAGEHHYHNTFLHEVAHAIQHHTQIKFRRENRYYVFERAHGRLWQDVMVSLGCRPVRTHRIPEALRKAAVHITPSGKVIDPSEGLTI